MSLAGLQRLSGKPKSVTGAKYGITSQDDMVSTVPTVESVIRRGKKYDKKTGGHHHVEQRPGEYAYERALSRDSPFINSLCCISATAIEDDTGFGRTPPPDIDFHASSYVKLTHGVTAYKFMEPSEIGDDEAADNTPVIVCLHGLMDSSYIWGDLADLLCDFERGPNARVLVYDFYGRGRSPWTSVPITIDVLVTQLKELLEYLDVFDRPVHLIGYDLGGAVALGFSAKFGTRVATQTLIAPFGLHHVWLNKEKVLRQKYLGEILMMKRKAKLSEEVLKDYLEKGSTSPHANLLKKQKAMVNWQIKNTPGYVGAILSTYRLFPLRGMQELYMAVGRHTRPTLVIWGDHDEVCPYKACMVGIEEAFPNSSIVDIRDCGHNCLFEKFEEVAKEVLAFHKTAFNELYLHADGTEAASTEVSHSTAGHGHH
jgi:pimeloyl-ACP methyl ester carboxylesterase